MRPGFRIIAILLAATALAGFASNRFACSSVEALVLRDNREHLTSVRRSWRLPERHLNRVQRGGIVMRTERDPEGRLVTLPMPPNTPTPFSFAHASSWVPFVVKVRYGWADGGTRMSFGEGGEMFVASFFGWRSSVLRRKPSWYF
jgi:hypothetical protein